jgi:magnesium-transporting ATPase (P-type)
LFFETLKTDALLNNFQDVESQPFTVIRDGSPLEILGKDIVVGDIITVEHDHKVPADIRILDCTADLIVDNSAISSAPDAENSPRHWRSEMDHPLLTENLMFRGTAIKEGSLKYGVVIKVGDDTQAGRMLKLASVDDYDSKFKSALQQEIDRTTYLFLWFAFGLAFTSMIILFLTGTNYEAVVIGAGILVSSVPLGLPIVIAMTQRVALDKLKVNGVIMKGSSHVEILGSTSCIITDKTGTLASDQLVVANAVFYTTPESKKKGGHLKITETGLAPPELMEEYDRLAGHSYEMVEAHMYDMHEEGAAYLHRCAVLASGGEKSTVFLGDEDRWGPNIKRGETRADGTLKTVGAVGSRYDHVPPSEPGGVGTKKEREIQIKEEYYNKKLRRVPQWRTVGNNTEGALLKFYHGQRHVNILTDSGSGAVFDREDMDIDGTIATNVGSDGVGVAGVRDRYPDLHHIKFGRKHGYECFVRCIQINPASASGSRPELQKSAMERNTSNRIVYMKGRVEDVLPRCVKYRTYEKGSSSKDHMVVKDLTKQERETIKATAMNLSRVGLRVLVCAESPELQYRDFGKTYEYKAMDQSYYSPNYPIGEAFNPKRKELAKQNVGKGMHPRSEKGLIFVGMLTFYSPEEKGVPEAITTCKDAGIRVIMTTGDSPYMAIKMARRIGIFGPEPCDYEVDAENKLLKPHEPKKNPRECKYACIDCTDDSIQPAVVMQTEDWWDEKLTQYKQLVVANCPSLVKERLAKELQRLGHVVACVGNRGSDVPVLKAANVGVAFHEGAKVAQDAADIILDMSYKHLLGDADEDISTFTGITTAILHGRLVFDNLKKAVAYVMISNVAQVVAFMSFVIFQVPLPIAAALVVLCDLGTNTIPALSMAFEKPETDIMHRPPRNVHLDKLVNGKTVFFSYLQIGMMEALAGIFAYLVVMNDYGYSPNLLLALGSNDYFGTHPLYCKFSGGQYVNVNGEVDLMRHPERHAPSRMFPLWDTGDDGYVEDCVFPLRWYEGEDKFPKGSFPTLSTRRSGVTINEEIQDLYEVFKLGTATSYANGGTAGYDQITVETIDALENAGYYEYIPWRSRMSWFWDNRWLAYDLARPPESSSSIFGSDAQIPLKTTEDIRYEEGETDTARYRKDVEPEDIEIPRVFQHNPMGLYSICLVDKHMANWKVRGEGPVGMRKKDAVDFWNEHAHDSDQCETEEDGRSSYGCWEAFEDMGILPQQVYNSSGFSTGCLHDFSLFKTKDDLNDRALIKALTKVNADSSELITAKASPADIVWENALFCNGDRSYDRLLKDLLEAEDLTPADYADGKYTHNFLTLIRTRGLTSQEDKVKGIADKAYACSLIDDHPHQLLYCADKCAYDCDSVPPFMRSKSEVHTTTKDDDGMPTFQTTLAEGVRQCGNIGSRMAQHEALLEAKSAFWTSMVLCQIAAIIAVRTRWLSIGTHGMDNDMTNFGIYFAFFFSACMLYAPWGNRILATRPLRFTHWLPGLPWAVMIFTYDEARKFLMRVTSRKSILPNGKTRRITGWLEANTYY